MYLKIQNLIEINKPNKQQQKKLKKKILKEKNYYFSIFKSIKVREGKGLVSRESGF